MRNETIRDRLWSKAAQKGIPLSGAFELLPVCNFSCKMCYVRKSMAEVQQAGGLLRKDFWLDIARQARDLGMLFPLITGGEPFLHPDFQEITTGMLDMGMQPSINSNGSMVDRETAAWLGKHRPIRINITLYGASEQSYEELCGNGAAFGKVQDGVRLLKEYGVPVKFNTSVTPDNFHELENIMKFAQKLDCPIQVATYMFPPVRRDNSQVGINHRLEPEKAALARVTSDYLQNEPQWFLGQTARFLRFVPLDQLPEINSDAPDMKMRCRAGNSSLWLDWEGNLSDCGMYHSTSRNLKQQPLKEAWQELLEETRAFRYRPRCSGCPNMPLCHPCIAMVQNESGSPDGRPEYVCRMNQAQAKYYREFAARYYPDMARRLTGEETIDAEASDPCGLDY